MYFEFFAKFVYKRTEKVRKASQMKLNVLKLKEITDFREFHMTAQCTFFTQEGQFHGKCHGSKTMNQNGP